ncbi:hypothetical protein AFK71_02210 [Virgibacillus pantothenticus]|uniref:Uncharacterized protein n=1 Tax=Virgibacillus pantothenticus TaxID=1473 RepID=A0A0L0QUV0_VIRPA|nr:hypothetical protein AFK71_02210 [Virgibacillus pantothenticus]
MANDGRLVRLKQIYDEIETLNPEILSDLNKVIRLYSQAQMLIGYLDADALYRYGAVYAERKRVHAEVIQASRGTVAEKESLLRKIIAYRRDERTALEEYKKVNDIYGR